MREIKNKNSLKFLFSNSAFLRKLQSSYYVLAGNKNLMETYKRKAKSQWGVWQIVTWPSMFYNILLLQKICASEIIYSWPQTVIYSTCEVAIPLYPLHKGEWRNLREGSTLIIISFPLLCTASYTMKLIALQQNPPQ